MWFEYGGKIQKRKKPPERLFVVPAISYDADRD